MMKTDGNHFGENGSSGGSMVKFELVSHPCSDGVTCSGESYSNYESECADQKSDDKSGQTDVDMSEEGIGQDVSSVAVNLSASHQNRDPPVFSSSFSSSNNLEVFKCVQCPYETYNLATLASHQKIHKLYQCDICQMKFSHAANMRRHRMRHTGFKPFECRVCLKRFFRKDHLMEHMITHSKQLPFQCPLCDKSFTRQVYFKAHLQTEHWNMPGDKICTICGHKAATIKGAKLHYTTRHAKAANTVNSSSPVNSRVLAEDIISPSVVTRSSLMSARLQTGPTLVTTEHHRSPSASDSESFPSLNLAPLDGCVTSSQLIYPQTSGSLTSGGLMSDTMNSLISPLSVNSSGNEMNDLGDNSSSLIYPLQMAPKLSIRSHLLSPPPSRSLRNPPSPSITLHRIDNGRHVHRDRKQKRPVQSCNGASAAATSSVKVEPQDDVNNNNSSSSGSEDEDINHGYINAEANSSRNHSNTCSPNSTLDLVKLKPMDGCSSSAGGSAEGGIGQTVIHQRHISTVGDLTITPLDTILVCVHCGIVFPDQTLYFLHKGVHSENNPWKCNICGELCRDKYDFNTHILSKAHQ